LRLAFNRIKAIRDAVGADIDIVVEMNAFTDTTAAIQFGRMIEQLGIYYYEEPVMPLNPKQMKKVADSLNIPIATGERIYTRWGFRPFFESGCLDVVQPDIGNCGGLTETKKVCDMAHLYDLTVQLHICGGPIATAAALQLEAVIPNFIIHETHRYALLEPNTKTCKHNYLPKNGFYEVPDLPGLGQELTDETIAASVVETVK
jgi:L-alanine-DL-glutamate epimerase-like enolase superfamily enzyme